MPGVRRVGEPVTRFNLMTADLEENERRIRAAQENLSRTSETRPAAVTSRLSCRRCHWGDALDAGGRVRTMNQAALRMLGIAPPGKAPPGGGGRPSGVRRSASAPKVEVLGTRSEHRAGGPGGTEAGPRRRPRWRRARAGCVVVLDDRTEFLGWRR